MNRLSILPADLAYQGAGEEDGTDAETRNREEFGNVYEHHLPDIYSYFLAHTRSQEDAADLAQQVFTQALTALPRYRDQGLPVAAWLFRIARNLLIDSQRRSRPTVSWDLVPESLHPPANDDVESAVLRREAAARLGPVLDRLDPEKRDLLVLRFAAGLKVPEIAAVVGRSEPAIRSELRRVLQALREGYPDD